MNNNKTKIERDILQRRTAKKAVRLEHYAEEKWYYPVLAPFSKTYEAKLHPTRIPLKDRIVLDHIVSIERPSIIYAKNSKAACTSIAHAMYQLACGASYNDMIHLEDQVLLQGRDNIETNLARFQSSEFLSFTFVRHPVDRIESAFTDFVVDRKNARRHVHIEGFKRFGIDDNRSQSYNFDAFLDYVEFSQQASRFRCDRHWRLQVDNIGWGRFKYDFVGKVENMEKDFRDFLIDAGVNSLDINKSLPVRKNTSTKTKRFSSKSQFARIRKIFSQDFSTFDYN